MKPLNDRFRATARRHSVALVRPLSQLSTVMLAAAVLPGCGAEPVPEQTLRDDLTVTNISATISNGLSNRIEFEIPPGVDSFLMEVRGDQGKYFLTEFINPDGRDQITTGYAQRGAIEVSGLVDWLYPNDGSTSITPGPYSIVIRGTDVSPAANPLANEDIIVKIYKPLAKPQNTCGIQIDFLVDSAALTESSYDAAFARIVDGMNLNLRQVGIKIANYQVHRVDMQSPDIDLGNGSATAIVDDVLDKTFSTGAARSDALHVLVVRSVFGSDHPQSSPYGYSMGLPGPYEPNLRTSGVLVSTELFASGDGVLDADGLASTVLHELGHFLGLYHTSETRGDAHDPLDDTAECQNASLCTDDFQRNVMTSAAWIPNSEPSSRNLFTANQGSTMRRHPLCLPMAVDPL